MEIYKIKADDSTEIKAIQKIYMDLKKVMKDNSIDMIQTMDRNELFECLLNAVNWFYAESIWFMATRPEYSMDLIPTVKKVFDKYMTRFETNPPESMKEKTDSE